MLARFAVPKTQNYEARGFFAPGSKFFVLASTDEQGKAIERVYAVPSAMLVCQLPAATVQIDQGLRPIVFSADGRLAAVFSKDMVLSIF